MPDIIRDAPVGQIIRYLFKNRLRYREEIENFKLHGSWMELFSNLHSVVDGTNAMDIPELATSTSHITGDDARAQEEGREQQHFHNIRATAGGNGILFQAIKQLIATDGTHNTVDVESKPIVPKITEDGSILVDWYFLDDPDNPQNWSNSKRFAVCLIICIYTFIVYTSSAIYISSNEGIMREFGVTEVKATLGLSLYVLGYGMGPLLFSPLGEIPRIGRSPVYIVTMFLFVIISIAAAFAPNYPGLMVLRFLQGFFGSPCLAAGGATLGDMYSITALPYAMTAWVSAAFCGPALGPLLSGFSIPVFTWRWSLYEVIWASAPVFILMFVFLPETSGPNIMLRRAQRLRRVTGNQRFVSQSEIAQRDMKVAAVVFDALIKPMEITIKDPAVLFVQIYMAIIYGIYYSFFEAFPLVYPVYYDMNLGQVGLVFLCILVSCLTGVSIYSAYIFFYVNPRIIKLGLGTQEKRLIPALVASFGPTFGLFIFAWASRPTIHWIVPTIGITIYSATCFIIMQCIFVYIPLSYPPYASSLFAANDFFRSAFACGSVLFAYPLFGNLGVAKGVSLLGGLSVIGIVGIWLLYVYGAKLRAMSRFALSN